MTSPSDTNGYPKPEPERVERALRAMRARRAKLRRFRIVAVSGALVVVGAVAILAVGHSPTGAPQLHVAGSPSTTTGLVASTAAPTTTVTSTVTSTASSPTTALPEGTQEITYQPFTATGSVDPSLRVTARVTGTCLNGESKRSYRCFDTGAAAGVYDPCFAGPRGTTVPFVCPLNPATGDVVEITTASVTVGAPVPTARPWAMQLSGGTVCLFVSAAWGGLGPYDCQFGDSSVTPSDCRPPQSSNPWWTVECQDQKTAASPFTAQRVTKVWF